MKIFLTGTGGFVGKQVEKKLKQSGHIIYSLSRPSTNLLDKDSLLRFQKSLPLLDCIIHLAAMVPKEKVQDSQILYKDNVTMTKNLLTIFGKNTKKIIFISSIEVLMKPLSWYAKSKLACEKIMTEFGTIHHTPTTILRLSVLYGPGDMINRAIPNFIKQALNNKPITVFGGEELRDYLHVDDAAQAIVQAVKTKTEGTFLIGSGMSISVLEAAQIIKNTINPSLPISILPRKTPKIDLVCDISRTKNLLQFTPKYIFPDKLGLRPML